MLQDKAQNDLGPLLQFPNCFDCRICDHDSGFYIRHYHSLEIQVDVDGQHERRPPIGVFRLNLPTYFLHLLDDRLHPLPDGRGYSRNVPVRLSDQSSRQPRCMSVKYCHVFVCAVDLKQSSLVHLAEGGQFLGAGRRKRRSYGFR